MSEIQPRSALTSGSLHGSFRRSCSRGIFQNDPDEQLSHSQQLVPGRAEGRAEGRPVAGTGPVVGTGPLVSTGPVAGTGLVAGTGPVVGTGPAEGNVLLQIQFLHMAEAVLT